MSLTLVTGVPGSSKTLYSVAILLQNLLKSTVEVAGEIKPIKLFTNVKNLLLEHEVIDADNLNNWHEWAKPGDAICFDEVQHVWRPRAMGQKVSPAIEALETHRHMGVDLILITQHPMLLDQNIRRLVGRHIHFRPFKFLFWKFAVGYEWDHASNPAMVKNAMSTFTFWHKKKYYNLYKSAEAHTVQQRKMPFAIWILLAALVALFFGSPMLIKRLKERYNGVPPVTTTVTTTQGDLTKKPEQKPLPVLPENIPEKIIEPSVIYPLSDLAKVPTAFKPFGCLATINKCTCYGSSGDVIEVTKNECVKATKQIALLSLPSQPSNAIYSIATNENTKPDKLKDTQNIDSGFNLPITNIAQTYAGHTTQASGQIYSKPAPAGGVMYGGN